MGRRAGRLGRVESMVTGTESLGKFGDRRMTKLSSGCFYFSGVIREVSERHKKCMRFEEKGRFRVAVLENRRVN